MTSLAAQAATRKFFKSKPVSAGDLGNCRTEPTLVRSVPFEEWSGGGGGGWATNKAL